MLRLIHLFFWITFLATSLTACRSENTLPGMKNAPEGARPGQTRATPIPTHTLPSQAEKPAVSRTDIASSQQIVKSDIQREISPQVEGSALEELSTGNRAFALDMYQALRGAPGNIFYSPYSLSIALAMTYAGARADTELQIKSVLHYSLPQENLHLAFNALDLQLTGDREASEAGFQLSIANSLWGQENFPFLPEFLDLLARNYGVGMRLVDFLGDTQRERARQAINTWVSEETGGKIEALIEKGVLTVDTRLVLANAVYFKGEWIDPFLNGTTEELFTRLDGSQVRVPMMSRRANALYAQGDDYQAVEIPYKGERFSMLILLPAEGRFEAFEKELDGQRLESALQALSLQDVKLYLPKFRFEAELQLEETLKAMGMEAAFDPLRADFSGMYDRSQVGLNLFLSHVVHKAFVAVDEIGTEAAAATGVVAEIESQPAVLRADRPFLFLILDRQTETILFIGRLVDPL